MLLEMPRRAECDRFLRLSRRGRRGITRKEGGCNWTADAPTEEALMKKVADHAAEAHGIKDVTPELAAQAKAAIRDATPA